LDFQISSIFTNQNLLQKNVQHCKTSDALQSTRYYKQIKQTGYDPIEKFASTPLGSKVMVGFKYFMKTFGAVLNAAAFILLLLSGFFYYWFWMPLITPFASFLFFINYPLTLFCGFFLKIFKFF
jgi:hypothetical protein